MDPYLHTIIALGCMAGCYYAWHYFAAKKSFKPLVEGLLDRLEADGFIHTKLDKDGDKELIPISEIMAKTLRDSIKLSK